jgi:hypothetical protein
LAPPPTLRIPAARSRASESSKASSPQARRPQSLAWFVATVITSMPASVNPWTASGGASRLNVS